MSDNILNLDELFGQNRPVIVEWKGKRYEMLRPDGMTLEQNMRRSALSRKLSQVTGSKKNPGSPDQKPETVMGREDSLRSVKELEQAMNACLKLLCPAILAGEKPLSFLERIQKKFHPERFADRALLTFNQKVAILEFYSAEVFKKSQGKGTTADGAGARKKPTGA